MYEVESKDDWKINQISTLADYGFKKIPEYNVVCPKCKCEKYLGFQTTDAPFMINGIIDILSERKDWETRFRVTL